MPFGSGAGVHEVRVRAMTCIKICWQIKAGGQCTGTAVTQAWHSYAPTPKG